MPKTKVLITVKTYPSISKKYNELVCTAGFLENGNWIRIYPVQFRKKSYGEQYAKYDWIELDLVKNTGDARPESFRPLTHDTPIAKIGHINTEKGTWRERRKIVLKNARYDLINLIKEAKDKNIATSLAVYKPKKILDFTATLENEREWSQDKLAQFQQQNLFETKEDKVIRKLPYKFKFHFLDETGKQRNLMIEDWETGQLFWKMFDKYKDEKIACEKVRDKYFNDFAKTKDLYFFLGTTLANHFKSRNPFVIIGTFHPKRIVQTSLFT